MTSIRQFAKNNNYTYTLAIFDIAKVSSNAVVMSKYSLWAKSSGIRYFFHVLVSIWTDIPNMDKTDKQANCLKLKKVEIKGGELELKQMVSGSGWMAACSLRPCADNIIHCKVPHTHLIVLSDRICWSATSGLYSAGRYNSTGEFISYCQITCSLLHHIVFREPLTN